MTLKKAMLRGLLGAPIGVFISYTITVLISLSVPGDSYSPVVPQLTKAMNSEIGAVVLQYILSAVMGFAYGAVSCVFEVEQWGIAAQTALHFVVMTIATFPIAYINYWMPHTLRGIVIYVAIFLFLYLSIWLLQMYFWRKRINSINHKLQENNKLS